jgi:excinuclease ABC subunit B
MQPQILEAAKTIEEELEIQLEVLSRQNKLVEKQRLEQRTRYDIEALREFGYCSGIENYSRHIDQRKPGQRPFTLFDYFGDDYLFVVDESHVSIPQVKGMFNGDRSRKQVLVEYGFRLPSALDNRPLNFEEFLAIQKQTVYVSATPGDFELERTNHQVVEQIIRPTGLIDPTVVVKPSKGQIDDLIDQVNLRKEKNQRVLITTLTVKMAEDLTSYLVGAGVKAIYLHHETKTLERIEVIRQLRKGKYDALVGINLLREGIDIPEVSLVAILDADKEGFLRSYRALVQTIGRAARNSDGTVIMYADRITDSMSHAIEETNRRRDIQIAHNLNHNITPQTIVKEIRDVIAGKETQEMAMKMLHKKTKANKAQQGQIIMDLEKEMHEAARVLDFERAAMLRDIILELKSQ